MPGTVAFSADRSLVALGSGPEVQLWRLTGPGPERLGTPLTGHDHDVGSLAFAPDGHTLAVVSGFDKPVLLWDITDPAHPLPLAQPAVARSDSDYFHSAAFSPDGRTLAIAGSDPPPVSWSPSAPGAARRTSGTSPSRRRCG